MINKLIWVPRILMALYIILLLLLATDAGPLGFFIEAIPGIIFLLLLIILWRRIKLQGIILIVLALVSIFFFHTYEDLIVFLIVSIPPIATGIVNIALSWKGKVLEKI